MFGEERPLPPDLFSNPKIQQDLVDSSTAAEKMFPEITKALGIVRVTDPTQLRYYAKEKTE